MKKTYDIHFNNDTNSNSKGFKLTKEEAINYIKINNGTNHSYFADYKGGTVQVVCNQNDKIVYETEVL